MAAQCDAVGTAVDAELNPLAEGREVLAEVELSSWQLECV
jgi:hypothetical protein